MSLGALRSPPFYMQMDTLQYTNECDFDGAYSPTHSWPMDTTNERGFGDRLNELMQAHPHYKGRGQSALARDTGVPQATISRILQKANAPEMATVVKLARALGVACEWLLTERGPKYVSDMRIEGNVYPEANVADAPTPAEISTLINCLQILHDQVFDLLTFVKGIPSISSDSEHSDHMHNSPARANVAAAANRIRRNQEEDQKHEKHRNEPGGRKTR